MSDIEWLFYHLWFKPHMIAIDVLDWNDYESTKEKISQLKPIKFPFNIPDTIILNNGEFDSWYFKSKEGTILK